jgi:hypothetical protein
LHHHQRLLLLQTSQRCRHLRRIYCSDSMCLFDIIITRNIEFRGCQSRTNSKSILLISEIPNMQPSLPLFWSPASSPGSFSSEFFSRVVVSSKLKYANCLRNCYTLFQPISTVSRNFAMLIINKKNHTPTYFARCVALITREIAVVNFLKNIVSM